MDINLFEEFNRSKINRKNLLFIIIFSLIIISTFLAMVVNHFKIIELNSELNKRMEIIENPKSQEKITEVKELSVELVNGRSELEQLTSLDNSISAFNIITNDILQGIHSSILDGLILSNINFNENIIEVIGVGVSPSRIAEYSKTLARIDNINNVHISNISLNEDYYEFLIILTIKGDSIEAHN